MDKVAKEVHLADKVAKEVHLADKVAKGGHLTDKVAKEVHSARGHLADKGEHSEDRAKAGLSVAEWVVSAQTKALIPRTVAPLAHSALAHSALAHSCVAASPNAR